MNKVAATLSNSPAPPYPYIPTAAGVEGEVHMQLVVDSPGCVDAGSIRVLASSHDEFNAGKTMLPRMQFILAKAVGEMVRMVSDQCLALSLGHQCRRLTLEVTDPQRCSAGDNALASRRCGVNPCRMAVARA